MFELVEWRVCREGVRRGEAVVEEGLGAGGDEEVWYGVWGGQITVFTQVGTRSTAALLSTWRLTRATSKRSRSCSTRGPTSKPPQRCTSLQRTRGGGGISASGDGGGRVVGIGRHCSVGEGGD